MKLTDTACKSAKPKEKPYKKADGGGLYLEIMPNGAKYWRLKYRYGGKENRLALGVYPQVTIKEARQKREDTKRQLAEGINPSLVKKQQKLIRETNTANTFKAIALEWHERQQNVLNEKYSKTIKTRLEKHIFPHIGSFPITEVTTPVLLEVLRKLDNAGKYEIAKRMLQTCSQIFRYAIQTARAERDPTIDLRGALTPVNTKHYRSLDVKDLPDFLNALDKNACRLFPETRYALELIVLTFVRTKELIGASWEEIDFDHAQWTIPAKRMKMRRDHIVPLSTQALEILQNMRVISGHREYVFPGQRNPREPMSDGTLVNAIKRLGFKDKTTTHGFRAMAMTIIKERLGYRHEIVDRQLAHARKTKVDAAYDRAEFLPERREMMQRWSDYVYELKTGGNVVHGDFKRRA